MRRAARTDANQAEIVEALRAAVAKAKGEGERWLNTSS